MNDISCMPKRHETTILGPHLMIPPYASGLSTLLIKQMEEWRPLGTTRGKEHVLRRGEELGMARTWLSLKSILNILYTRKSSPCKTFAFELINPLLSILNSPFERVFLVVASMGVFLGILPPF